MATKDDEAAFPCPSVYGDENVGHQHLEVGQYGMSLRDFFAAHAPPVPDGFPLVRPAFTPAPTCPFHGPELDQFQGWGDWVAEDDIRPDLLAAFCEFRAKLDEHERGRRAENARVFARRQAEWAYALADAMLAARAPTTPQSEEPR